MALCGFSLDNLSLMALTIATGFVVDDAIVMIENIVRLIEEGKRPLEAACEGAAQIGFTVVSLTVSLVAVFIPLLFMPGSSGGCSRNSPWSLTISVVVSMVVSLTLTPMMCGRLLKPAAAAAARAALPHDRTRAGRHARRLWPQPALGAAARGADAAAGNLTVAGTVACTWSCRRASCRRRIPA